MDGHQTLCKWHPNVVFVLDRRRSGATFRAIDNNKVGRGANLTNGFTNCQNISPRRHAELDRKSTRLNSSHVSSSYAVFFLKKTKLSRPGRADEPSRPRHERDVGGRVRRVRGNDALRLPRSAFPRRALEPCARARPEPCRQL